jgi:hypothetical protein
MLTIIAADGYKCYVVRPMKSRLSFWNLNQRFGVAANWLGSECKPNLPEPRLKFVLILMGRNLKNSFVFATVAFLTACQTPQASNQQDRPVQTGQSRSPSSQYEVEPISGIQWPLGAPGTFQPGSGRGP